MSKAARFISTSLLALALASLAWGAPEDPAGPARPEPATVAYLPGVDAGADAALLRGLRRAFADAPHITLEVGRAPHAWSNAAPEAVRLAFERNARVLIAPPDRRVAHLMAQIATRVQVPLVSTSQARSVGATGSYWVSVVTRREDAADTWEAVGERAGWRALELLEKSRSSSSMPSSSMSQKSSPARR